MHFLNKSTLGLDRQFIDFFVIDSILIKQLQLPE